MTHNARHTTVIDKAGEPNIVQPPINNTINDTVASYSGLFPLASVVARVIKSIAYSPLLSGFLAMILDSGTTHHMSENKALFVTYLPLTSL